MDERDLVRLDVPEDRDLMLARCSQNSSEWLWRSFARTFGDDAGTLGDESRFVTSCLPVLIVCAEQSAMFV